MKSSLIALTLLMLVVPALAQDLNPALEGEGHQVQTLELLDGAVSVSVESSGSLSLGRGADQASGSIGVTVNDLGVGIGDRSTGGQAATPPTTSSGSDAVTTPVRVGQDRTAELSAATDGGETACTMSPTRAHDLTRALDSGLPMFLREVPCRTAATTDEGLVANERVLDWLSRVGLTPVQVVSITIDDTAVIVDHAPAS